MAGGSSLTVHAIIKPASRRPGITRQGDTLRIAVNSPPIEGRANAEAVATLASAFGVPKSRVELLRGARSRIKKFRIVDPTTAPDGFDPNYSRDDKSGGRTSRGSGTEPSDGVFSNHGHLKRGGKP